MAAVLRAHGNVRDAVVLTRKEGGDKRLAFVITRSDHEGAAAQLVDYLKQALPDYVVSATLATLSALPLTSNGKVDRTALLSMRQADPGMRSSNGQPSSAWELLVADVWRGLLEVDGIGVYDNVYDLGGHSLLAIQMVAQLEARTGLKVSPRDLAFHTLKQFAARCEARLPLPPNSPPVS